MILVEELDEIFNILWVLGFKEQLCILGHTIRVYEVCVFHSKDGHCNHLFQLWQQELRWEASEAQ